MFYSFSYKQEQKYIDLKKIDSKKKPAQPKESDDRARENLKVKEGATEKECVAGPVVTRALAKKSDKVHPLKVKEAMSSDDKSTTENLQKDSTLKKCFDRTRFMSKCMQEVSSYSVSRA